MEFDVNRLKIASRCPVAWDSMEGDDRTRHCSLCKLHVYNFENMSNSEIAELVSKREGRVCARMFRRADGKIITKDCPRGAFRTRMKFAGAALIAAICLVFSLAKADKLGFLQSKSDLVRAFKSMYSAGDDYVMGEAE